MTNDPHPLLYSFRRCPYAIRARLGLLFAEQSYRTHEVSLKDKPASMLAISPKGEVPVLQLVDGTVIDESLDIILWALRANDPLGLLMPDKPLEPMLDLIALNDGEFKHWLDCYKYADRHPEHPEAYYRDQADDYLRGLDQRLSQSNYLFGEKISVADIAIMPFIRQFAHVDKDWFDNAHYPKLQDWLQTWLSSEEFITVFAKSKKPSH